MLILLRRILLGLVLGAVIGFVVYRIRACTGGACPLTCNPYVSTAIGGLMGVLISLARDGRQSG